MNITNSDIKNFMRARSIANVSDYERYHIGAVAIYQKCIIGIGCNTNKTHPMQKKYNNNRIFESPQPSYINPKAHAEIMCLSSIQDRDKICWDKVKIYIYRTCKSRDHGLARPCKACMAAIKEKGIKHIYYTTDDGYAYEKIL